VDALVLPVLGGLVVAYLIYIWVAWLSDKQKRALTISEDDEEEGTPNAQH
jgi:hypothetical protein